MRQQERHHSIGQSLAETAIFLPILIFIIAGIVEVGNMLLTQNRVTTASRAAAGFGATHYQFDDWDKTATDMGEVVLNTVTDTLDLADSVWDIWSIRAKTNDDGTAFETFTATHVYGNESVVTLSEWSSLETQVQTDMLAELQSTGVASAKNLEVVASAPFHNIDAILGMPIWEWANVQTIRGLTVMRVGRQAPYTGCPRLPIAIKLNQYSAYPGNWDAGVHYLYDSDGDPVYPWDPVGIFPSGAFDYPSPGPTYQNAASATPPQLDALSFEQNVPGVPMSDGNPGYLYWVREGTSSGGFGWLTWDGDSSSPALAASLTYPGNFEEKYPGGPADTNTTGDPPKPGTPVGGDSSTGDGNGDLEIGEWVEVSTGNIHSSVDVIKPYVDNQIPVTIILYDLSNGETGVNTNVRVNGFVIVKILGFKFTGSNKWAMFQFVSWGSECVPDSN